MTDVNKYQAAVIFAEQYIERCRQIQNMANSENFFQTSTELCKDQSPIIVLDDDEYVPANQMVTSSDPPILEIEDSMEAELSDIHITGTSVLKEWIDISELRVLTHAQDEKNDNLSSAASRSEDTEASQSSEETFPRNEGGEDVEKEVEENKNWADLNVEEDIKEEEVIEEEVMEESGEAKHRCKHCPYKTNWKNNLTKHVISRHLSSEEIEWLHCAHCSYKAKTKEYLKIHLRLCHEPFIQWVNCPHCTSRFKTKQLLKDHILHIHTAEKDIKWFKCEQCIFQCKMKAGLKNHIRNQHTDENEIKWHKCDKCSYKSKVKKDLRSHILCKHTEPDKIEWFKCDKCLYKAKSKKMLKVHVEDRHMDRSQIRNDGPKKEFKKYYALIKRKVVIDEIIT